MPVLRIHRRQPPQLHLVDEAGGSLPIHPIWLRERCRDGASLDRRTEQRLYNPSDLAPDLTLAAIDESLAGYLDITFSDGHRSRFAASDILTEAGFAPDHDGIPVPQSWNGGLNALPRYLWRDDLGAPERAEITQTFLRYGFVILEGVPTEPGSVLAVARRFGFPRDTNFGTLFDVRSVPDANDLAYTALGLEPHTDNPYRSPVPGVQLLHCLINRTAGGLSTLVDGLAVAQALRERDRQAFDILTRTPVRFRYVDTDTEHVAWAPLIEYDAAGRLRGIHFSPRLDFAPLLPVETLDQFYRARRLLDRMLKSDEFEIRFRLDDGDLVMFDNCRLLHGRTSFDPNEGLRHLQGCYIDIDGPRSLYRVLRRGSPT